MQRSFRSILNWMSLQPTSRCLCSTFSEARWRDTKKPSGGSLLFSTVWVRLLEVNTMTA